jgi:adenylosuccinate synthase
MIPAVVIGSGYGDEGKGATVNYLSTPNSTVIRFNGGAQAGHTVVHNGFRHVFSHFGSGTLKGAKTHLSRFFVCNPIGFYMELKHLLSYNIPTISVSPKCYVTIPYDHAINRAIEDKRGQNKHGSVGIGFGETIERSERGFALCVSDIRDYEKCRNILRDIQYIWIPQRCKELDIKINPSLNIVKVYHYFTKFLQSINLLNDEDVFICNNDIIFEGAQGLMLDPEYGTMPYCTRSSCGLNNIRELLGHMPYDVYYVSRPYTTRHGVGPLPFECDKPYPAIIDHTNEPNQYQGQLRYSPLNIDEIIINTALDQLKYGQSINRKYAVMTCLDQIKDIKLLKIIKDFDICECTKNTLYSEYSRIGKFIGLSNEEHNYD